MELYGDQLSSDTLQFGFKKHSGCCHALFTFKETTKYFIKKGSKVYCAFVDASKAFDKVLQKSSMVAHLTLQAYVNVLGGWHIVLNYCYLTFYNLPRPATATAATATTTTATA